MTSPRYESGLAGSPIEVCLAAYERQKAFAEHTLSQLDDEGFFHAPRARSGRPLNSPAVIVQHMAGNMRSRFTDFLTTDGEKPDRDRESEFAVQDPVEPGARSELRRRLMNEWEASWAILRASIAALTPADLDRTVTIRGAPHSVFAAITRLIDHYAFHVGQLNTVARLSVGADWQWFTIPPGGSRAFNEEMERKHVK